ncbi:hypothetical protein UCDDS831_g02488 [Diplodia seriata]|uniref:Uncharacterized protein n=1 Tax=Diplodia seriata TaxID=420778 RepID=A0A0G2EQ93_9PEZI|nr:hypothetical protein UCDDS831_g02488 [Diplodia seriata]
MAPPRARIAKGKRKANKPTGGDNQNDNDHSSAPSAPSSSGGGSANLTAAQQLLLNPAANIQPNVNPATNIQPNVNINPAAHHHSQNSNSNNSAGAGANASAANTDPNTDHDPRTCGCCNLAADQATYTPEERDMMAIVAANIRAQMVAAGRITGAEDTRAIVERQEREREEAATSATAAAASRESEGEGVDIVGGETAADVGGGEASSASAEKDNVGETATATATTSTTAMEGIVLAGDADRGVQQQEGESGGAVNEGRPMQEFTFVDEGPALMMESVTVAEDDHPMQESAAVAEDLVPMEESGGLVAGIPSREELFAVAEALGRFANRGPPENNASEAMVLDKPSDDAGNDNMLGDGKDSEHDKDKNKNSDDNVSNSNEERMETENVTSAAEPTRTDQPGETSAAVSNNGAPNNGAPDNENEVSASARELKKSANKIQDAANKLHEIADAFDKGPAAGVALVEPDNSSTDNTSAPQPPASAGKKKKAPAATPVARNTRSRATRSRSSAAAAASAAAPAASSSATTTTTAAAPAAPEIGYMTIFHIANEQEPFDARIYSLLTPSAALSCERERYAEWWRRSHGHVGKLPPATLPVPNDLQDPRARWRLDKRVGREWSEQECAPAGGPVGTAESVVEPLLDAQGNLRLPAPSKAQRKKGAGNGKGGAGGVVG